MIVECLPLRIGFCLLTGASLGRAGVRHAEVCHEILIGTELRIARGHRL